MEYLPLEQVYLHQYSIFLIEPLSGGPLLTLTILSVLLSTLLLINSAHNCTSTIMWLCCIVTEYQTPTSSFLAGAILRIGNEIIRISAYVPHGLHYPLI